MKNAKLYKVFINLLKDYVEMNQEKSLSSSTDLVSIVLPTYNQSDYLPYAVDSILSQTHKNLELIVVNDGSTDGFKKAIAPFLKEKRIFVINQDNKKLPAALNAGFHKARGQFFTWTSADNLLNTDCIETLISALHKNPKYGFAYSDYTVIDDNGDEYQDHEWRKHNRPTGMARLFLPPEVTIDNFHNGVADNFIGASFLWRSDVHHVVGIHDENLFGGEDYDFWIRMNLVTEMLHVNRSLYQYRVHQNTINSKSRELALHKNRQKLRYSDKLRRALILAAPNHVSHSEKDDSCFRSVAQYKLNIIKRVLQVKYSEIEDVRKCSDNLSEVVVIVDIESSDKLVSSSKLSVADIAVCDNARTANNLKSIGLPLDTRIFIKSSVDSFGLLHAVALRYYEKQQATRGYSLLKLL